MFEMIFDLFELAWLAPMMMLGLFGGSNRKSLKRNRKRADRMFAGFLAQLGPQFALQQSEYKKSSQFLREGAENARTNLSRSASGSRRATLDRNKMLAADIEQQAVSSGLGRSSVRGNVRRALGSDTNRRLEAIDAALSGSMAGIDMAEGGALAQNQQGYVGLLQQQSGVWNQSLQARIDMYTTLATQKRTYTDVLGGIKAIGGLLAAVPTGGASLAMTAASAAGG